MSQPTLRVTCAVPSMLLADGQIVGIGDAFDLPFADDPDGHRRVQRYVEEGTVDLAQAEPSWWVHRPATIRMQALVEVSYCTPDGRHAQRGDIIHVPASTAQPYGQVNGMTERDIARTLVTSGVAMLIDETPPWWNGAPRGSNLGEPLPTPRAAVA